MAVETQRTQTKADEIGLDPADWSALRALGHRMVDDMIDRLAELRSRPVWRRMPESSRAALYTSLPREPSEPDHVYEVFKCLVQPYTADNTHPRFMGWVQGGGNAIGMLAELLAAGLNANLGGRDQSPIEVERQVIRWAAEMLGLPACASGLLVTGSSVANLIAIIVARTAALGSNVRRDGVRGTCLAAYASAAVHVCVPRAFDVAGLGSAALRKVPTDAEGRMKLPALRDAIKRDREAGARPFILIGTCGSVDIGAVDDLAALSAVAQDEAVWFHVDAAFGALAALSPRLRPLLSGIELADSIAFDFHKWAQVPYDAGCILVRNPAHQLEAFAAPAAYLRRERRGLAGGEVWPCDLGVDLSRGFRALKVWMTLCVFGADRLGAVVEQCCRLAQILAARIDAEPCLERLAPVALNIVCFRFIAADCDLDELNIDIVADLQESGIAVPSTTTIGRCLAIRAAIVNHRTRESDVHALVSAVIKTGTSRVPRQLL
jgi:aromatic-L-amino-acid/L-tryptophan decarboxylase